MPQVKRLLVMLLVSQVFGNFAKLLLREKNRMETKYTGFSSIYAILVSQSLGGIKEAVDLDYWESVHRAFIY